MVELADPGPGSRPLDRVELFHQGEDGVVGAIAIIGADVVLDFLDPDDVGIESLDPDQQLGELALVLLGGVGAPAFEVAGRSADVGPEVEGREEVEHIERRHPQGAVDRVGRGRAGVGHHVGRPLGGLDPVQVEGVSHHPGHVLEDVPSPEGVGEVEDAAVGMEGGIGVLAVAPVVEGDSRQEVGGQDRSCLRRPGLGHLGGLELAGGGEDDLVEAVEVEVLGYEEVLLEGDEHPLVALELVGVGDRKRDRGGVDRDAAFENGEAADAAQLGLAVTRGNSFAVPVSWTRSPAATGVEEKTKMPSEVRGSASWSTASS